MKQFLIALGEWLFPLPETDGPRLFAVRADPPDDRDYQYEPKIAIADLPHFVDFRANTGGIEDQGKTGSCTGNASISLLECMTKSVLDFSRLFPYFNGREGTPLAGKDEGAYLRSVLKSIAKYGVCLESLWPFDPARVNDKPSAEAYADAAARKILRYERVDRNGDDWKSLMYRLKQAMAEGYPVVFSMPIGERFYDLGAIKTLQGMRYKYVPVGLKNLPVGGHAMFACGYDDELDGFIVENSWSKEWGDNGYCLIPYTTLTTDYFDFWIVKEFADIKVEPAPKYLTVAEVLEAYRDIGRMDATADDDGVKYWSTHATEKADIYRSAEQFLQPALKAYAILNGRKYCD